MRPRQAMLWTNQALRMVALWRHAMLCPPPLPK